MTRGQIRKKLSNNIYYYYFFFFAKSQTPRDRKPAHIADYINPPIASTPNDTHQGEYSLLFPYLPLLRTPLVADLDGIFSLLAPLPCFSGRRPRQAPLRCATYLVADLDACHRLTRSLSTRY